MTVTSVKPFLTLTVAFTLLCLPCIAQSQTSKATALSGIDTYTAEIDRFIKANPKSRLFGDVSSTEKTRWREVTPKSAENLYETAEVWTRQGKVVAVNFFLTSPSGDWAHFITYYFRDDGTLARIKAQLNTFYGNVSVLRDRYYDPNLKLLKSTQRYLDLESKKPVKRPDFMDQPIPIYSKVSTLPFRRLL